MRTSTPLLALGLLALLGGGAWFLSRESDDRRSATVHDAPPTVPPEEELPADDPLRAERWDAEPLDPFAPSLAVTVRVTTEVFAGSDVPDFEVVAGFGNHEDPVGPELARGRTDAQGRVRLELPLAVLERYEDAGDLCVWAMATEGGYQARRSFELVPEGARELEVLVLALPGATVLGRLFDTTGAPCAGHVYAERSEPDGRWPTVAALPVADLGRFELQLEEPGTYRLFVAGLDGPGTGTALHGPFEVSAEAPSEEREIRLVGPGTIRGRVTAPDGSPRAGLELAVQLREVGGPVGDRGDGFAWRTTETDAAGAFAFHGLREGLYFLRTRAAAGADAASEEPPPGRYPHLVVPEPVPSDGEPLAITR